MAIVRAAAEALFAAIKLHLNTNVIMELGSDLYQLARDGTHISWQGCHYILD